MLTEDILSIDFSSGRDGERLRNTDVRETHRTVASRPGLGIEPATQLHVPDWALNLQPFGPIVVCSIYWTTPASIIFQYYKTFFSFVHRFWEREMLMWDKHRSVASCTHPNQESNSQSGICPDQKSNPSAFVVQDDIKIN